MSAKSSRRKPRRAGRSHKPPGTGSTPVPAPIDALTRTEILSVVQVLEKQGEEHTNADTATHCFTVANALQNLLARPAWAVGIVRKTDETEKERDRLKAEIIVLQNRLLEMEANA